MESSSAPQETHMQAEPQKEHRWLEKLIGEWEMEGAIDMGPDRPSEKSTGTERVRSLGGLWFIAEGTSGMPGVGEATTIMTLGYDPEREKYVGSWIGSMMTHQWVYEGQLDEDERILTLDTEGPDMSGRGGTAKYKDVIEFKSDDHRVLTSHTPGDDGTWRQFVEVHYRRTG